MSINQIYEKTKMKVTRGDTVEEPKTITIKQNTAINVSVAIVIMFAGALITATTMFVELRGQVAVNKSGVEQMNVDISNLKAENTIVKVELAKVQSQLTSIESHLIDLKEGLRAGR